MTKLEKNLQILTKIKEADKEIKLLKRVKFMLEEHYNKKGGKNA